MDRSVVAIREKFGEDSLVPAVLIEKDAVKVKLAHDAQWG